MNKDLAYFGGYGKQYWLNLMAPTLEGTCDGITVCSVDRETGHHEVINAIHGIDSPATLVVSPDRKYLYATNELNSFKGQGLGGGISAFAIDGDGGIRLINQVSAAGSCTAYVTIDKTGKYLFVANHGSYFFVSRYNITSDGEVEPYTVRDEGCVCVYEIREDGGIGRLLDRLVLSGTGVDPIVHAVSHPHSIIIDDEGYIVIPNKGGDNIYFCRFDYKSKNFVILSVLETGPGSAPRHAYFSKNSEYLLISDEYDAHICSYRVNKKEGRLERISKLDTYIKGIEQPSNIQGTERPWAIDVQLHRNNRFVYIDNTQNVLSLFYLEKDGSLKFVDYVHVEAGSMVRGMQMTPDGKFLTVTCVTGEKAVVYSINEDDGRLAYVEDIFLNTPTALRYVYKEEN